MTGQYSLLMIFILALALWVSVGYLLLWYYAKDRSKAAQYRRTISSRICDVDEAFQVNLLISPPSLDGEIPASDIILCFDESGSMGAGPGSPLQDAMRVGETFVKRCPSQIQVGIVRFSDQAEIAAPLKATRHQTIRAIKALGSGGDAAINEALAICQEALNQGQPDTPKVIVLFSNGCSAKSRALAAKACLLEAYPNLTLLCVGLKNKAYQASYFSEELLKSLADQESHCLILEASDSTEKLYQFLFRYVSDGMAISGVIEEEIRAPHPFQIINTGSIFPIETIETSSTQITWPAPVLEPKICLITYRLIPECCGWHKVTLQSGSAVWNMPDGSQQETRGPATQRILALHSKLGWAWPILNPLFFLIFGGLIRKWFCQPDPIQRPQANPIAPLDLISLPEPLPKPERLLSTLNTVPALVIGLGEAGDWALSNLKQTAMDRGVPTDRLSLLTVDTVHVSNRRLSAFAGAELDVSQRVVVGCDLRPYLENLRGGNQQPGRDWVPWHTWLAASDTINTRNHLDDRRKARLSLLIDFKDVEARIKDALTHLRKKTSEIDGQVVIYLTGAVEDSTFSGMAAEIAHICACQGHHASLVMARTLLSPEREAEVAAMGRELERLYMLGGETILSDRTDPPAAAKRIFDKILIHGEQAPNMCTAGHQCADLIWPLLAYTAFEKKITSPQRQLDRLYCWSIVCEAHHLPLATIWRWVVAQTLTKSVLLAWLSVEKQEDEWLVTRPDKALIQNYADLFWKGENLGRPIPQSVALIGNILALENPVMAIYSATDNLPSDALYARQKAFWQAERTHYQHYCEAWVQHVLNYEQGQGRWGLLVLTSVLKTVQSQFARVLTQLERYSGDETFVIATKLLRAMVFEMTQILDGIDTKAKTWLGGMLGPLVDEQVSAPKDQLWLTQSLERNRYQAERDFSLIPKTIQNQAKAMFDDWWLEYGMKLTQHLHFDLILDADKGIQIQLRLDNRILTNPDSFLASLEEWLGNFRPSVMRWPFNLALADSHARVPATHESVAIGKLAGAIFPNAPTNLNDQDPHFAGLYLPRQIPLHEALHYSELPTSNLPFTWPEENNADRLALELRHRLQENVVFTNPRLIDLLRYPDRLKAFLADVIADRLVDEHGQLVLLRGTEHYPIGQSLANQPTNQAMDRFEKAARNAVVFQTTTDGKLIPPAPVIPVACAQKTFDSNNLTRQLHPSPKWLEWGYIGQNMIFGDR